MENNFEGEYEILESDLILLEDPKDFSIYLYSLHDEIEIYDVGGLYDFFNDLNWVEHCIVLEDFKKRILKQ